MIIKKAYKIEKILENVENSNYPIRNAKLEGDNLIATDGHILGIFPIEREKEDTDGLIPKDAFSQGRKILGKKVPYYSLKAKPETVEAGGGGMEIKIPRPKNSYPDWKKVVNRDSKKYRITHVNVARLRELLDALGPNANEAISIGLPEDSSSAIQIKSNGAEGYLMPMRVS